MRILALRVPVAAAILLAVATPLHAKAPLDRVTIVGGGLAEAITILDQDTLRLSNPWFGSIAHWSSCQPSPPPVGRPVYEITLHVRMRGPEVKPIYQFRYAQGSGGQPGLVYLPGKGEPWYRQNVRTIYRSHEGHWHPAASEWEARIQKALSH